MIQHRILFIFNNLHKMNQIRYLFKNNSHTSNHKFKTLNYESNKIKLSLKFSEAITLMKLLSIETPIGNF